MFNLWNECWLKFFSTLSEEIKELREMRNLQIRCREVAEQELKDAESGKIDPSIQLFIALADHLDSQPLRLGHTAFPEDPEMRALFETALRLDVVKKARESHPFRHMLTQALWPHHSDEPIQAGERATHLLEWIINTPGHKGSPVTALAAIALLGEAEARGNPSLAQKVHEALPGHSLSHHHVQALETAIARRQGGLLGESHFLALPNLASA